LDYVQKFWVGFQKSPRSRLCRSARSETAPTSSHRPQTPPLCCHLRSYFMRPKSSPVRPLACNWYHCAHFVAKPKPACALRFSWAAVKSSNLGLCANMTSSIKPEVHNVSLRRQRREDRATVTDNTHKNFGEDRTCSSEDMIVDRQTGRQTDRHTHTHTHTHAHHNTPLSYRGRSN